MKKHRILIINGLLILIVIALFSFKPFQGENHPILQKIGVKLESYFNRLPQQKVFLHFDKTSYQADETVWFKAYLVDAGSHRPDSSTTNLYVDLINPSGYNVQSKLIRLTNGFGNGEFSFQDTIPEGVYKIRAFTNWMRNMNEDFFFEKQIYVANPEFKTYITREEIKKIKKERKKNSKKESNFDVQFLPEGGHLLAGVESRLGFKALNELGQGALVSGEIIDSKGITVAKFKSSDLGMGSVVYTPDLKIKYTALVNIGEEKPLKINLPEAIDLGVNIAIVNEAQGNLTVKLIDNFPENQLPANTSYYLLAHTRGKVLFTHEFDLKNPVNIFNTGTSGFPTGIIHLCLFNMNSQPVSERLVFINNNDELKINIEPSELIALPREKLSLSMKVTDKNNIPVKGNFSVSVTNTEDAQIDDNIVSNLLLNSDLRGKVENPRYYFTNINAEKSRQLDDLMLTQGWRRFSWNTVLSETKIPPKFENEKGIIITGNITKEFFNIPLRDIKVTLSILNEFNDIFTTRTVEYGKFRFDNLDYQDTVSVSIEAVRASGRKNLLIFVDSKPAGQDKEMLYQTRQNLKKRGVKGQYKEPENPEKDDPFYEENNRISRIYEEPSAQNVIIVDDKLMNYRSVGDIITGRIPGVMVTGGKVVIRGISSINGSTSPLFLVDGIPVEADYALNLSPYEVERIEVIKGPSAAIYGSRGANGVIAIYTRRGKFMIKGVFNFKMMGYHTPKEYYNPGKEYKINDIYEDDRRTILWIPYITTGSNGEATSTLYTSDEKGKYKVRVEGISPEGIPGVAETEFEVK